MHALGYTQRRGAFTYGIGLFVQGGTGIEYDAVLFLAMSSGAPVCSGLSVSNVILPFAYRVSPELTIGATLHSILGAS